MWSNEAQQCMQNETIEGTHYRSRLILVASSLFTKMYSTRKIDDHQTM
jgi:hypothetical protein